MCIVFPLFFPNSRPVSQAASGQVGAPGRRWQELATRGQLPGKIKDVQKGRGWKHPSRMYKSVNASVVSLFISSWRRFHNLESACVWCVRHWGFASFTSANRYSLFWFQQRNATKKQKKKENDENGVFPLFSFHSGTMGKKKLRSCSTMDGIGGYFDKIVNKNAALVVGILA